MLMEFLGIIVTSLLAGSFLLYKLTGDLYPRTLKRFLYGLALKNWRSNVPKSLEFYNLVNPKSSADVGTIPCRQENELEAPRDITRRDDQDDLLFYGIDDDGNALIVRITRFYGNTAAGSIYLHLNGRLYTGTCLGHCAPNEFAIGTLKLELVEAMRNWRLWFNGPLRDEANDKELVHGTINILWKPLYTPADLQKDANVQLLAEHLAGGGKFGDSLFDLKSLIPVGYKQFGAMHGIVRIEGVENDRELYLYGNRFRRQLTLPAGEANPHRSIEVFAMCGCDGNAFSLSATKGVFTDGVLAHVCSRNYPIKSIEAVAEDFDDNHSMPKFFTFQGNDETHRIDLWEAVTNESAGSLEIVRLKLTLNTEQSRGIIIRNLNTIDNSVLEALEHINTPKETILSCKQDFVDLESSECLSLPLVGGKGASLAALTRFISCKAGDNQFKTSPGFCVTTSCFRRILDTEAIDSIFNKAKTHSTLEAACSEVQNLILSTRVEDTIAPLVSGWMNKTFVECKGGKLRAEKFAVRSSGTLEDGADLSCAGQNETFLGVKEENIARKIVECWASLFTAQSVRYRLNHGQPALSDMGVVVQAMVNASAAGVIFSADPITGNPFDMLINANFGLGESVVSASCDPDTIRVSRSRDGCNTVSISSITLGEKKSKIVLNDNDTGSTQEIQVNEQEAKRCCVSEETALQLGKIAIILVESNDGKPLDMEWAVEGNQIYILQSRNITSLDSWTDFEIIHEFDTALRTQFEVLTTANVGEVMPGAVSPLGLSVVTRSLDMCIQGRLYARYKCPPVVTRFHSMSIARHRLFMNVLQIMYRHNDLEIQPGNCCVDLAICGHIILNEEYHKLAVKRWGVDSGSDKIKSLIGMASTILQSKKQVRKVTEMYRNYHLPIDHVKNDSEALFNLITDKFFDLYQICQVHCEMSEASTSSQVLSFVILSEGKKVEEWDSNLYNDVSKISSVCSDVESADIPTAIDILAEKIVKEGDDVVKTFTESSDADAVQYVQNHAKLSKAFNEFMDKHGHRGVFELDLMRQSWKTDPQPFIYLLKSVVTSKTKFKDSWKQSAPKVQYPNDDALLDALDSPIKSSTRKILKFVLPYCRSSVWNREKTKSILVWVGNEFKLAYNALGEQLVRDQLITSSKLVYFFTHYELSQIIARSPASPRILYKAMRREKLHNSLQNEKYPEIIRGFPEPIDDSIPVELGDQIKATPVSSGKIQGTAKVCQSVTEASDLIKPGDILITTATDIGWSPFFPMLGGVVTELGGLISHGAVVAREYGLPCIVGATHATKVFKTGDIVLLNANEGTLSKVKN